MKQIGILVIALTALMFSSCKKRTKETVTDGTVKSGLKIKFNTICNGQPITIGTMNNTNAMGQTFSIDLLKYYISQLVLVDNKGNKIPINNYDLIDISKEESSWISLPDLPSGTYTSLKINLGIDSNRNHQGAQDGDLDPIYGMIWTWNTGYIFYKHEGNYIKSDSTVDGLQLHLGTDRAYATVTIPIYWEVSSASNALYIDFDINKMYNSPAIDFNVDNNRQSSGTADFPWIDNMKANTTDAFTFNKAN